MAFHLFLNQSTYKPGACHTMHVIWAHRTVSAGGTNTFSQGGFLLCNIHYQKQTDWWPLTFESILSVTCMQTGTHLHSFKISQKSNTPEIKWVKSHPLQCVLVRWLVSAMHNVCFPKWNRQQLICVAARHSVLTDLLPCPRAICTIPKDNTAAARVTKLQPTAIQRRPNRWPCH